MYNPIRGHVGRIITLLLFTPLFLAACAQTQVVDSWQTETPVSNEPTKVAVIAVLPEALMRKAVEIDVAKILAGKGTPAVPSSNIPGFGGGIRGEIDVEVATGILRDADVDGIVVMFYSGGGNSEGYVRSDYWVQHVGSGMAYSWGRPYFTGFTDVYTVRQGPGWADVRNTAYVESSYYDMSDKKPVWRIVTFTKDTEHTDAARDIAGQIASEMRSAGLN
ncbi:MAG: hypothetical protein V2I48_13050 [Xanthomonadales bacterium]|jgi:hypothetical protein|nr:hypothetical protein [Xanthomonadales bacterium]